MKFFEFVFFFCIYCLFTSCTVQKAEEKIESTYANGIKKSSLWVYPNGEISKKVLWYSNGVKEYEIPYKNGVPHGKVKRWTGFGDIAEIGFYKNGLKDGKWTSYFNDKTIEAIRFYKADHPIGRWEGFHFNRNNSFEEFYSEKGDSIGIWKKWRKNGKLSLETNCFSKTDSGFIKKYDNQGILESLELCKNGKNFGAQTYFFSDGKKIQLQEFKDSLGNLNGPRTFYLRSGEVLKQEFWKNGERDSIWWWHNENGDTLGVSLLEKDSLENLIRKDFGVCGKEICAESTFIKLKDSLHFVLNQKLWYKKDGHSLLYEEFWENGEKKISQSYYVDGLEKRIASEGFWKKGKRNGIWRNWYQNGVLKDSLHYINGERIGEQFGFDEKGNITIHKTEYGKNRPVIMKIH